MIHPWEQIKIDANPDDYWDIELWYESGGNSCLTGR